MGNTSIESLAYSKWKKAGKPEGNSLHFWLEAEREWKEFPKELLKLPMCPVCKTVDSVSPNYYAIMDAGFHCACGIEWTSRYISFNEWWCLH
jgi:hypothetical protein